jgi:hypothetical protein
MVKPLVLESLVGEKVTIICKDRKETVYHGQLLEISRTGPVIKHLDHGREFIEFIPMDNVSMISHKVLGK